MPRNPATGGPARFLVLLALGVPTASSAQSRHLRPEDLFRIEAVGPIAWSPDRRRAAVEITRPGKWLDPGLPTAGIHVVDVASTTLRIISSPSRAYVGFFGAAWSPDGRRLLYFSADTDAVVRPWLWDSRAGAPRLLAGLELHDGLADPPVALWSDDGHALFLVRDGTAPRDGPLYVRINRDRNVADAWARARKGALPAVTVLDSRGPAALGAESRLVSVDLGTGRITTIARGPLHRLSLSADRRTLSYRRENPPVTSAPASSFFSPEATGEAATTSPTGATRPHM